MRMAKILALIALTATSAFAFPTRTNTLTQSIGAFSSAWTNFYWNWSDMDDQQIMAYFTGIDGTAAGNVLFRMGDPEAWWLTISNGTYDATSEMVTWSVPYAISHTNLPPPRTYNAEFLLVGTNGVETRSLAKGKIKTEWSLFSVTNAASWSPRSIVFYVDPFQIESYVTMLQGNQWYAAPMTVSAGVQRATINAAGFAHTNLSMIHLDPTSDGYAVEGQMYWDDADHTLTLIPDLPGKLQVGQEQWVRAVNQQGTTISDGKVVAFMPGSGNRVVGKLADANDPDRMSIMGIATHDITNSTEGLVTSFGLVRNIDTRAFAEGAPVYLSTTPGELTANPWGEGQTYRQVAGYCAISANNGAIFVSPGVLGADFYTVTNGLIASNLASAASTAANNSMVTGRQAQAMAVLAWNTSHTAVVTADLALSTGIYAFAAASLATNDMLLHSQRVDRVYYVTEYLADGSYTTNGITGVEGHITVDANGAFYDLGVAPDTGQYDATRFYDGHYAFQSLSDTNWWVFWAADIWHLGYIGGNNPWTGGVNYADSSGTYDLDGSTMAGSGSPIVVQNEGWAYTYDITTNYVTAYMTNSLTDLQVSNVLARVSVLGSLSESNSITVANIDGIGGLASSNSLILSDIVNAGGLAGSNAILVSDVLNAGSLAQSNTILLVDVTDRGSLAASNSVRLVDVVDAGDIAYSNSSSYVKSKAGNATNISVIGHMGINRTPTYRLDVNGGNTSNQIHWTSGDADSGGYLVSAGAANAYMSAGVAYDSTWRSKSTSGAIIGMGANAGAVNTYSVTGTSAGAAATIIETARFHANGAIINGPITNNATIICTNLQFSAPRWKDSPMVFAWATGGGTAPTLGALLAPFDGIKTLLFGDNNELDFMCQINHDIAPSNINFYVEPHMHVLPGTNPPGDANRTQIRLIYAGAAIGGVLRGPWTQQVEFVLTPTNHTLVEFNHLTNSIFYPGISGKFWGTIKRVAAANSNFSGNVSIDGDFHYPIDRVGSSQDASP